MRQAVAAEHCKGFNSPKPFDVRGDSGDPVDAVNHGLLLDEVRAGN